MFDPSISLDLNRLRTRLAKMDDAELQRFGHAAAYMTTQEANLGSEAAPGVRVGTRRSARGVAAQASERSRIQLLVNRRRSGGPV